MIDDYSSGPIVLVPDTNTSESIMYGSAYKFVKSAKYFWDDMEHYLKMELESLKGRLNDRAFCAYALRPENRMLIFVDEPGVDIDKMKDLLKLREICYIGTALRDVEVRRTENILYGRMIGTSEYGDGLRESGISQDEWKAATVSDHLPIEYNTVREKREEDEERAIFTKKKMEMKQEMDDYIQSIKKRFEEYKDEPEEKPFQPEFVREVVTEDRGLSFGSEEFLRRIPMTENPVRDLIEWYANRYNPDLLDPFYEESEDAEDDEIWEEPEAPVKIGMLRRMFGRARA